MIVDPDIIFQCIHCNHFVYINKKKEVDKIAKLPEYPCPGCGELGYENWFVYGDGNKKLDDLADKLSKYKERIK